MSTERREILFVHGADEWYGSDVVLHDIVRSLEGTEFAPRVVLPTDSASELADDVRLSGRLRALDVPVTSLELGVMRRRYLTPGGTLALAARTARSVGRIIATLGPSRVALVHSHTGTVLSGALVARRLGVPHVWHVSEIVERPAAMHWLLTRIIAASATHVVAVSESVRDHLSASVPAIRARCDVVYNAIHTERVTGADTNEARDRLGLPRDVPVVGMIGRVGTMKGQEILLGAAPAILRAHPETRFLLVGGVLNNRVADLQALDAMASRLGVRDHVALRGFDDDVAGVIAAMDVLVQPSVRPESFGMTVVEAMAAGKAVVAAAHGGAMETVSHGETGFLVTPRDPAALAAAVTTLLDDATLRARMGEAGRARALERFGAAAFAAGYLSIYRALVTPGPA